MPEQVYQTPQTRFVAQFTGAAGKLHGEVRGQTLRLPGTELPLPFVPAAQGPVDILLRPEAVTVHPAPTPRTLAAQVKHCAYSGAFFKNWLEVDGGHTALAHSPERLPADTPAWLSLDPHRLFMYPAAAHP